MHVEAKPIRLSATGKLITVAVIVALAIWLIHTLGNVMTPFVAAAITAYLFNPLISYLHRRTRITRAVWILVLYVLIGVVVYSLIRSLGPIIVEQFTDLRHQIPQIVHTISRELAANQTFDIGGFVIDLGPIEQPIIGFVTDVGRTFSSNVPHLFAMAIETMLLFITYLIITFYFLLQADQIMDWLYLLVPAPYRDEIRGLGDQIDDVLSSYVRGTLLLIPIMSAMTYIVLSILGVRYALVLAIATGFLEVIPLVGPWSAAGIAMTVALFQPPPQGWDSWLLVAAVGITYFVLRVSEDSFVIPHVVGHAVNLHPILVMFAILAGGTLGGAFGLLVSIPVVAVVRLLLRYIYRKLIDAPDLPPSDVIPPQKLSHGVPKAPESASSLASSSQALETPRAKNRELRTEN